MQSYSKILVKIGMQIVQALKGSHRHRQKDVEFAEGSDECDRHVS